MNWKRGNKTFFTVNILVAQKRPWGLKTQPSLELIRGLESQMIHDKHTEISFIFILVNIWTETLNTHYHLQQLKNIKYFSAN